MKGSVVLVAATLAAAIILTAVLLLLASTARSIDAPPLEHALIDVPPSHRGPVVDNF